MFFKKERNLLGDVSKHGIILKEKHVFFSGQAEIEINELQL
jgi:hypothetical protein